MSTLARTVPNRLSVLIALTLCLLTSSVNSDNSAAMEASAEAELNKLHVEWLDRFWIYLESSETAQFRIASAIRIKKSGDSAARKRGEKLIDEVLSSPNPDPASLWLIVSTCPLGKASDWCQRAGVYDMLTKADPGNVATLVLHLNQFSATNAKVSLDTEANRQLLLKAAEGNRFDFYWGRNADRLYAEALDYAENYEAPPIPDEMLSYYPIGFPDHAYAFLAVVSTFAGQPIVSYSNLLELCRMQIRQRQNDTIGACKKLAGILRNDSFTLITQNIGFAMEKSMRATNDPNHPGIQKWWRRQQIFHINFSCNSQGWFNHIFRWPDISQAAMMAYAKNLSELGELRAMVVSNQEEYEMSPERFSVNPAECEKLQYLDDEAIASFLNGQNAQEAWQTMQIEAGRASNTTDQ